MNVLSDDELGRAFQKADRDLIAESMFRYEGYLSINSHEIMRELLGENLFFRCALKNTQTAAFLLGTNTITPQQRQQLGEFIALCGNYGEYRFSVPLPISLSVTMTSIAVHALHQPNMNMLTSYGHIAYFLRSINAFSTVFESLLLFSCEKRIQLPINFLSDRHIQSAIHFLGTEHNQSYFGFFIDSFRDQQQMQNWFSQLPTRSLTLLLSETDNHERVLNLVKFSNPRRLSTSVKALSEQQVNFIYETIAAARLEGENALCIKQKQIQNLEKAIQPIRRVFSDTNLTLRFQEIQQQRIDLFDHIRAIDNPTYEAIAELEEQLQIIGNQEADIMQQLATSKKVNL